MTFGMAFWNFALCDDDRREELLAGLRNTIANDEQVAVEFRALAADNGRAPPHDVPGSARSPLMMPKQAGPIATIVLRHVAKQAKGSRPHSRASSDKR